jgi:hypothetical protein
MRDIDLVLGYDFTDTMEKLNVANQRLKQLTKDVAEIVDVETEQYDISREQLKDLKKMFELQVKKQEMEDFVKDLSEKVEKLRIKEKYELEQSLSICKTSENMESILNLLYDIDIYDEEKTKSAIRLYHIQTPVILQNRKVSKAKQNLDEFIHDPSFLVPQYEYWENRKILEVKLEEEMKAYEIVHDKWKTKLFEEQKELEYIRFGVKKSIDEIEEFFILPWQVTNNFIFAKPPEGY